MIDRLDALRSDLPAALLRRVQVARDRLLAGFLERWLVPADLERELLERAAAAGRDDL